MPIELPCESKHSMRYESLRPSTATSVAVQVMTSPTLEALVCWTVRPMPTVVSSDDRSCPANSRAVFSIHAIIVGVASTSNPPEPTRAAVSFDSTVNVFVNDFIFFICL